MMRRLCFLTVILALLLWPVAGVAEVVFYLTVVKTSNNQTTSETLTITPTSEGVQVLTQAYYQDYTFEPGLYLVPALRGQGEQFSGGGIVFRGTVTVKPGVTFLLMPRRFSIEENRSRFPGGGTLFIEEGAQVRMGQPGGGSGQVQIIGGIDNADANAVVLKAVVTGLPGDGAQTDTTRIAMHGVNILSNISDTGVDFHNGPTTFFAEGLNVGAAQTGIRAYDPGSSPRVDIRLKNAWFSNNKRLDLEAGYGFSGKVNVFAESSNFLSQPRIVGADATLPGSIQGPVRVEAPGIPDDPRYALPVDYTAEFVDCWFSREWYRDFEYTPYTYISAADRLKSLAGLGFVRIFKTSSAGSVVEVWPGVEPLPPLDPALDPTGRQVAYEPYSTSLTFTVPEPTPRVVTFEDVDIAVGKDTLQDYTFRSNTVYYIPRVLSGSVNLITGGVRLIGNTVVEPGAVILMAPGAHLYVEKGATLTVGTLGAESVQIIGNNERGGYGTSNGIVLGPPGAAYSPHLGQIIYNSEDNYTDTSRVVIRNTIVANLDTVVVIRRGNTDLEIDKLSMMGYRVGIRSNAYSNAQPEKRTEIRINRSSFKGGVYDLYSEYNAFTQITAQETRFTGDILLAPEGVQNARAEFIDCTFEQKWYLKTTDASGFARINKAMTRILETNVRGELVEVWPEAATPSLVGDFNDDGAVNFQDFLLFAQNFGKQQGEVGFNAGFDLDGDGNVGFGDFLQFAQTFGKIVAG